MPLQGLVSGTLLGPMLALLAGAWEPSTSVFWALNAMGLPTACRGRIPLRPGQSTEKSEKRRKELLEFSELGGAAYCCVRSLGRSHEAHSDN